MKRERDCKNIFLYKQNDFFEFDKFFKENFEYSDELTNQRAMFACWEKFRVKQKLSIIYCPIRRLKELFEYKKSGSVYFFYCKIKGEYKPKNPIKPAPDWVKNLAKEQIKNAVPIAKIPAVKLKDANAVKHIRKMQLIICKKENKMHILMQHKDYLTCEIDCFAEGKTEAEKIENSLASIRALRKR